MRRLVLALAILAAAGCGVPVQDAPTAVRPDAVPSELLDPSARPADPSAEAGRATVVVQFVVKDRLVGSVRRSPGTAVPERLDTVLRALREGPNEDEQARGITSALPPGLQLSIVAVQGPRAVVSLSGETDGRSATENVLAVGQIVLSLTSVPSVREVTFERDGVPVEALLADGALTTDPLTAADYSVLRQA